VKPQKRPNRFVALAGSGLQMGITIYIGAQIGKYLDSEYPQDKNWFTIGFTLFFVVIAMYNLLTQVNRINDSENE
jgi:hypothetical protein